MLPPKAPYEKESGADEDQHLYAETKRGKKVRKCLLVSLVRREGRNLPFFPFLGGITALSVLVVTDSPSIYTYLLMYY